VVEKKKKIWHNFNMEETKKCPKCNGEMAIGEEGTHLWKPSDKKTFIGATGYHTYACKNCGYMESYLEKQN
jgi:predicted nucleic-acid-binding Zn-ribbon protein